MDGGENIGFIDLATKVRSEIHSTRLWILCNNGRDLQKREMESEYGLRRKEESESKSHCRGDLQGERAVVGKSSEAPDWLKWLELERSRAVNPRVAKMYGTNLP